MSGNTSRNKTEALVPLTVHELQDMLDRSPFIAFLGLKAPVGGTGLARYNATRQALSEEGIVLKHGYDVSVKASIKSVALHDLQAEAKDSPNKVAGILADEGRQPTSRTVPIDEGVRQLFRGYAGLSGPLDPHLIPSY